MDFFACGCDILTDPKIARFAVALGVDRPTAVGHLTGIYGGLAKHGDEAGDLRGIADDVLEDWALYRGEPQRFARLLREHFQDDDGSLHNWAKRNGAAIRRARTERDRKRRERAGVSESGTRPNAPRTQDSPQDSTAPVLRYKTRQDKTRTTKKKAAPAEPWIAPALALWAEHVGVRKASEMRTHVGPLIAQYGEERTLTALRKFAEHRRRLVERDARFIPDLQHFAGDIVSHLPAAQAAA